MNPITEACRKVLDAIADPLLIIDREYRVLFKNDAADRLCPEATGKDDEAFCYRATHGRNEPCVRLGEQCPLEEVLTTNQPVRLVHCHENLDGVLSYIEIVASPLRDDDGAVVAMVEILREISTLDLVVQLKQARSELTVKNNALQEVVRKIELAKQEWERTMDCVEDMVLVVDVDSRVLRCNQALANFTGRSYQQILGCRWTNILLEHGVEAANFYTQGREYFHKASGKWLYLNMYPIKDEGSLSGCFVVTIHDLTEVKRMGEELENKNQELKKAYQELQLTQSHLLQQEKMASIGQLAAGVAHEINNPIGFVNSNLGTMAKYMERIGVFLRELSESIAGCKTESARRIEEAYGRLKIDFLLNDTRDLIAESREGIERVKKIVVDLKGFSRVDEAKRQVADINACLDSTINIVWNELKYKATLKREYGEIPLVECFPQQLNQVFMNLLVNAGQAIDRQGEITVRSWSEAGSVFVSVRDTGCGIAKEHLDHIFEPFFTTKEVGKGTGLGLSIVYDIVTKKHGGEITVESEPGRGSVFTVRVPLAGADRNKVTSKSVRG